MTNSRLLEPLAKPVVGRTPVIDDPFIKHVRFEEVLLYLSRTEQPQRPWFAIDDSPGFYPPGAPVYWTDPRTGFTAQDIFPFQRYVRERSFARTC